MRTVLTIAGSDCSGGAGIQADLKAMLANGVYGMSVITALTAQNTTGVYGIMEVSPEFLGKQMDAVFTDIVPDAVKIGMISSAPLAKVTAERLKYYGTENIVVDPVMVSTSGSRLIEEDAIQTVKELLLPMASVITPNFREAEVLAELPSGTIRTPAEMETAAARISAMHGCNVLLKGGHLAECADDFLYHKDGRCRWYQSRRIDNPNTHGTGCTLSSAVASNLARGMELEEAVSCAKAYLTGCLQAMLNLGNGHGPLDHGYCINNL